MSARISRPRLALWLYVVVVLLAMIGVTTWASAEKNVMEGFRLLFAERWGIATLFDAYFGFLFFFAWVLYKESGTLARTAWLVAILCFGNIAMAIYLGKELRKLRPGESMEKLLLRAQPGGRD